MPRITDDERSRFHSYLDVAIDKMNNPKNSQKPHWSTQSIEDLFDHLCKEADELSAEVMYEAKENTIDESNDVINIAMMIIDNVRGNK